MIITIPFKTPSINHLYGQAKSGRRFLTKEAVELKKTIKELIPECELKESIFRVSVDIYEDWYCLNGSVARKDISNREKFLVDSIFEALGLDDKLIFQQIITKCQSTHEEKSIISIEAI